MKTDPLVSVLMCVYNTEKYLEQAVQSILSQTYKNIEFIIVDDGSQKQVKDILNNYINDSRIKIYSRCHMGLTKSLNYGLDKCRGKYIARQDADDISDVERIKEQVKYFEEGKYTQTVCGSYIYIFDKNKKYKKKNPVDNCKIKLNLYFRNCIAHGSVMFPRKIINEYHFYNERLSCAQDYELWRNLVTRVNFYNIPKYLYSYRVHEHAITSKHKIKQYYNSILISIFGFFRVGRRFNFKYL